MVVTEPCSGHTSSAGTVPLPKVDVAIDEGVFPLEKTINTQSGFRLKHNNVLE